MIELGCFALHCSLSEILTKQVLFLKKYFTECDRRGYCGNLIWSQTKSAVLELAENCLLGHFIKELLDILGNTAT